MPHRVPDVSQSAGNYNSIAIFWTWIGGRGSLTGSMIEWGLGFVSVYWVALGTSKFMLRGGVPNMTGRVVLEWTSDL